jgi:hypothetical protein
MGKAALICGCTVAPAIPLSATSSSTLHAAAHHLYQKIKFLFHWPGILLIYSRTNDLYPKNI